MDDLANDIPEAWSEHARAFLATLKRTRRLTYQAIGELCGLPKSTVSGIMLGEDKLTARALVHFANGLQVSSDEILGIGTAVALSLPRKPAHEGGVLDLRDFQPRRFLVPIAVDLPELGLKAGDLLEVEPAAPLEVNKIIVVLESDGVSRLYRVRSLNPTMLVRSGGPAVELDPAWHEVQGRVVRMERRDP